MSVMSTAPAPGAPDSCANAGAVPINPTVATNTAIHRVITDLLLVSIAEAASLKTRADPSSAPRPHGRVRLEECVDFTVVEFVPLLAQRDEGVQRLLHEAP